MVRAQRLGSGELQRKLRLPVWITPGVHPRAIAISNSLGHWWWEDKSGGDPKRWVKNRGNGWAQNHVLPIMADHVSGQQAFNDTVVPVRKVT